MNKKIFLVIFLVVLGGCPSLPTNAGSNPSSYQTYLSLATSPNLLLGIGTLLTGALVGNYVVYPLIARCFKTDKTKKRTLTRLATDQKQIEQPYKPRNSEDKKQAQEQAQLCTQYLIPYVTKIIDTHRGDEPKNCFSTKTFSITELSIDVEITYRNYGPSFSAPHFGITCNLLRNYDPVGSIHFDCSREKKLPLLFHINSLTVKAAERQKGWGTALVSMVLQIARHLITAKKYNKILPYKKARVSLCPLPDKKEMSTKLVEWYFSFGFLPGRYGLLNAYLDKTGTILKAHELGTWTPDELDEC